MAARSPHFLPNPIRSAAGRLTGALLLVAIATPAVAQYRAAGTPIEIAPDRKLEMEKAVEQARWNLGAVRIAPWIGVRDISYVRGESGNQTRNGDLTATAGAGLKAYLPLGTHATLAAHALPEYTWWQDESERNTTVGHYGLGAFMYGNRVSGEVTARQEEELQFLSSDLLVREPIKTGTLDGGVQVRVLGSIAVFVGGQLERVRVDANSGFEPVDPALLLDSDHDELRGGLRYLFTGHRGYVGAGALQEHTDFVSTGTDDTRSNEGSSWYAEAMLQGNHLDLSLKVDQRDLKPRDGSAFPGYSATNGEMSLFIRPGWRVNFNPFALRDLTYSALARDRFIETERGGLRVTSRIGEGELGAFYEAGKDHYFGAQDVPDEDVTAYGAAFGFPIGRYLHATVGTRETHFSSSGRPDRTVREVNGGLALTFGSTGEW